MTLGIKVQVKLPFNCDMVDGGGGGILGQNCVMSFVNAPFSVMSIIQILAVRDWSVTQCCLLLDIVAGIFLL